MITSCYGTARHGAPSLRHVAGIPLDGHRVQLLGEPSWVPYLRLRQTPRPSSSTVTLVNPLAKKLLS